MDAIVVIDLPVKSTHSLGVSESAVLFQQVAI